MHKFDTAEGMYEKDMVAQKMGLEKPAQEWFLPKDSLGIEVSLNHSVSFFVEDEPDSENGQQSLLTDSKSISQQRGLASLMSSQGSFDDADDLDELHYDVDEDILVANTRGNFKNLCASRDIIYPQNMQKYQIKI